ncbi:hypothetical protein ACFLY7_00095 [Patescibacteria group bacterium]
MYEIANNDFVITSFVGNQPLVLRDKTRKERIINHVNSGDYFGTLATVLDLTRQMMDIVEKNTKEIELLVDGNRKRMERIKKDLVYLQENYKIIKER